MRVRAERSLVVTGEGERIVMVGGGASFQDMAFCLIARHVGLKEARLVTRTYLLDWRDDGQRPFASLFAGETSRRHSDPQLSGMGRPQL